MRSAALPIHQSRQVGGRDGWVGDTELEARERGIEVGELGMGGRGRVREDVLYRMVRGMERGGVCLWSK